MNNDTPIIRTQSNIQIGTNLYKNTSVGGHLSIKDFSVLRTSQY